MNDPLATLNGLMQLIKKNPVDITHWTVPDVNEWERLRDSWEQMQPSPTNEPAPAKSKFDHRELWNYIAKETEQPQQVCKMVVYSLIYGDSIVRLA